MNEPAAAHGAHMPCSELSSSLGPGEEHGADGRQAYSCELPVPGGGDRVARTATPAVGKGERAHPFPVESTSPPDSLSFDDSTPPDHSRRVGNDCNRKIVAVGGSPVTRLLNPVSVGPGHHSLGKDGDKGRVRHSLSFLRARTITRSGTSLGGFFF